MLAILGGIGFIIICCYLGGILKVLKEIKELLMNQKND